MMVLGIAIQGLAECFLSPKYLEFASKQAPPGREGLYLGYAHMNTFFAWLFGFIFARLHAQGVLPRPQVAAARRAGAARARAGRPRPPCRRPTRTPTTCGTRSRASARCRWSPCSCSSRSRAGVGARAPRGRLSSPARAKSARMPLRIARLDAAPPRAAAHRPARLVRDAADRALGALGTARVRFLVWNLFLGAIPLVASGAARARRPRSRVRRRRELFLVRALAAVPAQRALHRHRLHSPVPAAAHRATGSTSP